MLVLIGLTGENNPRQLQSEFELFPVLGDPVGSKILRGRSSLGESSTRSDVSYHSDVTKKQWSV